MKRRKAKTNGASRSTTTQRLLDTWADLYADLKLVQGVQGEGGGVTHKTTKTCASERSACTHAENKKRKERRAQSHRRCLPKTHTVTTTLSKTREMVMVVGREGGHRGGTAIQTQRQPKEKTETKDGMGKRRAPRMERNAEKEYIYI